MNYGITEGKIKGMFHDDEITEAFRGMVGEALPNTPDEAIKTMFTSKMFKGVVPNDKLEMIFAKGSNWDKLFGADKVKQVWNKLVAGKTIQQAGNAWKWVG